MVVIVWGACFLIAPVWQFPTRSASYVPVISDLESENPGSTYDGTLVNVNTAGEEELTTLPGIGPAKAAAIVAYRTENGPFTSLEELDNVKGISSRMVASWTGLATTGSAEHGDEDIH
nr:ComEA family DNA-binding protein [Gemmiger formicilis]